MGRSAPLGRKTLAKARISQKNRATCIILSYILQKQETLGFAAFTKAERRLKEPSLQHVSDFQSLQDMSRLFFLKCKHSDKNSHLSSLSLIRAITYIVSKNTDCYTI